MLCFLPLHFSCYLFFLFPFLAFSFPFFRQLFFVRFSVSFSVSLYLIFSEIEILSGLQFYLTDSLRAEPSGDRIPVGTRFPAPTQTGPEAHQTACTMSTGSLSRG
jgi:hypothetical protein